MADDFDDLLAANQDFARDFAYGGFDGIARAGVALVTCMDSRIDPLAMLGLAPGDAKIIRNAGARVTPDALRSLVLAANLLGVTRVCVVQHTDCAMVGQTDEEIRSEIEELRGVDASGWDFLAMADQQSSLRDDIARIRHCELLASDLELGAFLLAVHTGELTPVAMS